MLGPGFRPHLGWVSSEVPPKPGFHPNRFGQTPLVFFLGVLLPFGQGRILMGLCGRPDQVRVPGVRGRGQVGSGGGGAGGRGEVLTTF